MEINIKRINESALIPTKATSGSAGFDLYCIEDQLVPAHTKIVFNTGIAVHLYPGIYGRIAPRSGLAYRHNFDVLAGVIDSDFVDEIKVMIFNHSDNDVLVKKHDRIAQLIFEKYEPNIHFIEVSDLGITQRSNGQEYGGLGSTGN